MRQQVPWMAYQKKIMQAINNFSGKKTIIMIAHRLKTVQKCDQNFF